MTRLRPTVLIVDDDEATRDGLTTLMESWGYNPLQACDGKAAVKICEQELPQAIVTDLMMPGMNGLELVSALGDQAQKSAIIFVTGQAARAATLARGAGKGVEASVARARSGRSPPAARIAAGLLRRADRQVGAHAPALPADRPDRSNRCRRSGERRKRHRERASGAHSSRPFAAP
jgi:CheY-like chemotaxis protein